MLQLHRRRPRAEGNAHDERASVFTIPGLAYAAECLPAGLLHACLPVSRRRRGRWPEALQSHGSPSRAKTVRPTWQTQSGKVHRVGRRATRRACAGSYPRAPCALGPWPAPCDPAPFRSGRRCVVSSPTSSSSSERVPVPRAVVAEFHQLLLLHPPMLVAHLSALALLVGTRVPEPHEGVRAGAHGDHGERDGVSAHVPGLVSLWAASKVRADMMPDMLPTVSCRPVAVARLPYLGELLGSYRRSTSARAPPFITRRTSGAVAGTHPSEGQADDDVQAAGDEEARKVMDGRGRVREQNGVAEGADGPEGDAEDAAPLQPVRGKGRRHVGGGAEEVARHREELDLGRRPLPQAVDDGGQKGGKAWRVSASAPTARPRAAGREHRLTVEHGVDAELGDAKGPDLPVDKGLAHVVAAKLLARLGVAVLPPAAALHQGLFVLGQEVGRRGVVGQRKVRHDAEDDARQALDDEDPAPAGEPPQAGHVADAVGEEAAQGAGDGGADEEVADAQRELVLGVEKGQVEGEAGEEAGLDDAEQKPAGDEAGVRLDEPGEGGDDAPGDGDEGDPAARGEALEDEVRRHLEGEVGDEEDRHGHLELRRRQAEVGLEPVQARVADVDAGGGAEQVEAHDERDDVKVQLADEPPLLDGRVLCRRRRPASARGRRLGHGPIGHRWPVARAAPVDVDVQVELLVRHFSFRRGTAESVTHMGIRILVGTGGYRRRCVTVLWP
ncbi:hypothetical protein RJ55_08475 [Drechmeria coniospora]|nr:hypothetical protein RJ55_08475 [Drechmeria coniospora]